MVKVFTAGFFLIMLPIYIFIGLQPSLPAEAANYPSLEIGSLRLATPVAPLELKDRQLIAPATIAGSYSRAEGKTLIIGHSTTVFKRLDEVRIGDEVIYAGSKYRVTNVVTEMKSDVSMNEILAPATSETLVIMTCAGEALPNQDATHRLLVTAVRI